MALSSNGKLYGWGWNKVHDFNYHLQPPVNYYSALSIFLICCEWYLEVGTSVNCG